MGMEAEYPPCPKCGGRNFKLWKLPNPAILHWVLNPGLAFIELVLGLRIPKLMLICQDCQGPLCDRGYVPCPHCHTMNHGLTWSKGRGFGNWLGYVCPSCGRRIPCLWNYTSVVILALTSPIWYLPYRFYFRDRIPVKPVPFTGERKPLSRKTWIFAGAFWGFFMWLFMWVLPEFISLWSGHGLHWAPILIGIPVCALGGTALGIWMYYWIGRRQSQHRVAAERSLP